MRLRTPTAFCAAAACLLGAGVLATARPGSAQVGPDAAILVSVGPAGTTALGDSVGADVADGGRWVVFQSRAGGGPWRINAHDLRAGNTVPLPAPGPGDATAPSVSADGRLVSFVQSAPDGARIYVLDRDADADGIFDQPGRTALHPATGTPSDLPYQRVPACAEATGGPEARSSCPPRLTAGGQAIVLPVEVDPDSPRLRFHRVSGGVPEAAATRLVDFGYINGDTAYREIEVEILGTGPVSFGDGPQLASDGGSLFRLDDNTCGSELVAPTRCTVAVTFHAEECDAQGDRTRTGVLALRGDTPGVHGELGLIGNCAAGRTTPPPPTDPCVAAATVAGVTPVPGTMDQSGNVHHDLGTVDVGRQVLTAVQVNNPGPVARPVVVWGSRPCEFRLGQPEQPEPGVTACPPGQPLAAGATCTAYVLVSPLATGRTVGSVAVDPTAGTRLVLTGRQQVAVVRTDRTGQGAVAAAGRPAPRVASVDSTGRVLEATQAVISADGSTVAFTSRDRLDGGPNGAGSRVYLSRYAGSPPAPTTIAVDGSPGGAGPLTDAASPAISGDGRRVAFSASGEYGLQVYAHDVAGGDTVLVSRRVGTASGGDSFSDAPDLSGDGRTVAYSSAAGDLVAGGVPGPPMERVYVRDLEPDFAGTTDGVNETASPAGSRRPSVDGYGHRIAFDTAAGGDRDDNGTDDVYLARRYPDPRLAPTSWDFGSQPVGAVSLPGTTTLTNAGVGPLLVGAVRVDGPFRLLTDGCRGQTLGAGGSCVVQTSFAPQGVGPANGSLLLETRGAEGPVTRLVTLTGVGVGVGAAPVISYRPSVVPVGHVTRVTGTGLPPRLPLTLTWVPGGGAVSVTTDASGGFTIDLVVTHGQAPGPRRLTARDDIGPVVTGEVLLVVPGTAQPPEFVDR